MQLSITTKIAGLAFLLVALSAGAVGVMVLKGGNAILVRHELENLGDDVRLRKDKIVSGVETLRKDVRFLAETEPLKGILRARAAGGIDPLHGLPEERWRQSLADLFRGLLRAKPSYIQARLIGVADQGREIVRVHRKGGAIIRVPDRDLQRKGNRPYFQKMVWMEPGEVGLSDINLNRERGKVTEPHLPVLRAGAPIYSPEGRSFGIVIINKNVQPLLNSLSQTSKRRIVYVTNNAGDFLVHPDPAMTFGFDLGERHRLQDGHPTLSQLFAPGSREQEISIRVEAHNGRDVIRFLKVPFDPHLPERSLGLAVAASSREVLAESISLRNRSFALTLLLIALASGLGVLFARLLVQPLRRITRAAQNFVGGAHHKVSLPVEASDEVGVLARAFQGMVERVEERSEALARQSDELGEEVLRRKRVEEEIRAKNKELETLLHVISHDLRQPLQNIVTFSQIVQEQYAGGLDQEGQDFLRRVMRGCMRIRSQIDDLLTLSRARRIDSVREEVRGEAIVKGAMAQIEDQIRQAGATVRVVGDLPRLRADKTWATHAVYNLIANALKFTRPGHAPEVEIAPYHPGKAGPPGLVVRDRGPGVSPEHAERIFQLFQRAVGREIEGTGAGLAIVKTVAERHGGRVWVQPRDGGGAEFIIVFG